MSSSSPKIGDFQIGKTIGTGSTCKVKIAQRNGIDYAVKIISKDQFDSNPNLRKNIYREISLMKLLDHPHLIRLEDVFESQRHLYIFTEYAARGELFDYLLTKKTLEPSDAFKFFRELIYGVEYLHQKVICHRDLKPENILLDSENHVKIGDFGFATWMKDDLAQTQCGSPHYAAPEIFSGQKYDGKKSDIWSCGVILYALLAGKLPFDDQKVRDLITKIKAGNFQTISVHSDIQNLISRMLDVNPDSRIDIPTIKKHPAFLMFLPENYIPPTPVPLPSLSEPVDTSKIDPNFFELMKHLGFQNNEELIAELTSLSPSMSKVFYEMMLEKKQKDHYEWPHESTPTNQQNDIIEMPKQIMPVSGIIPSNEDVFYRRRKDAYQAASFDAHSFTLRNQWSDIPPSEFSEELPVQPFLGIPLSIEDATRLIQIKLTEEEYEWIYPDDLHLYSRRREANIAYFFTFYFASNNTIDLTIACSGASPEDYEVFLSSIQELFNSNITSSTDPQIL